MDDRYAKYTTLLFDRPAQHAQEDHGCQGRGQLMTTATERSQRALTGPSLPGSRRGHLLREGT